MTAGTRQCGSRPRPRLAIGGACVLLAVLAGCTSMPPTEPYAVGSEIAPIVLLDQFGVEQQIDEEVRLVLFARDMTGGGVIKDVLAARPEALVVNDAVYVADISGMPQLIARMSAIPKMRERPYPTLLDRDGVATAAFPAQEGRATVMRLEALRVTQVDFVASTAALREALALSPADGE